MTQAAGTLRHSLKGTVGLQLYSLRHLFEKDVDGTLAKVRQLGFTEVETAGTYKMAAAEFRKALDKHGLRAQSAMDGYERLRDDMKGVIADARALGATFVVCGWIPHDKTFDAAACDRGAKDFNAFGQALRKEGLTFGYHVHGYEFAPSEERTLFDRLAAKTSPDDVVFEMDIFWTVHGGGNPVALLEKYKGRWRLMHLKDMARGVKTGVHSGSAPDETSVVLGTGQVDLVPALRAAATSGVTHYYIEDEHPNALAQLPKSIEWLGRMEI